MLWLLILLALRDPVVRADDLVLRLAQDGTIRTYGRTLVPAERADDLSPVVKIFEVRREAEKEVRVLEYTVFLRVEPGVSWGLVWGLVQAAHRRGGVYKIYVSCPASGDALPLWFPKDKGMRWTPPPGWKPPEPLGRVVLADAGTLRFDDRELGAFDGRNDREIRDALAQSVKEARARRKDGDVPLVVEVAAQARVRDALALLRSLNEVVDRLELVSGGESAPFIPPDLREYPFPPETGERDLEVALRRDGALLLGGKPTPAGAVEQVLADRLKQDAFRTGDAKSGYQANYQLFAVVEPEAPYAALVDLLERAQRGGIVRFVLCHDAAKGNGETLLLLPGAVPDPLADVRLEVRDGKVCVAGHEIGALDGPRVLQQAAERVRDLWAEARGDRARGWVRVTLDCERGVSVGAGSRVIEALWREGVEAIATPGGVVVELGQGWVKEE